MRASARYRARVRPGLRWWWLAAVLLGLGGHAHADAPAAREIVGVEYRAPIECPRRSVLEAAILERTSAAQLTAGASIGRRFAVDVARTDDGYVGTLVVDSDGGDARQLAAPRCDDLVSALALVISLAIDPVGSIGPPPAGSDVIEPAPRAEHGGLRGAVLGGGGGIGGVSPGLAVTAAIEGRLGWRHGHLAAAALFATDRSEMTAGDAAFEWLAARTSACWQWLDRGIAADACAHVEVGGLRVRATDVARAQETRRLWLAPGAHVALRWPRRSRWFGELQLGASAPLVRDHFHFERSVEIHRTWPVTPSAGLAVGVRFGRSR
jgi:hypothetical protein